jgi:hypothetical protein
LISSFTTHTFFSLHFSPTSLTFTSIAFFFTLCSFSSAYTASTIAIRLLVPMLVIRESRNGRCASGNALRGFGLGAAGLAFGFAASAASPMRAEGTARGSGSEGSCGASRCACSTGCETKVNGSIGHGVSAQYGA